MSYKKRTCKKCGGEIITPSGGYRVCKECGLCLERKFEGTIHYPLRTDSRLGGSYTNNQGVHSSDYSRLFQINKIYNKNGSNKKIKNFKRLEAFLLLLDLTMEQRYKLKDLFIESDIEDYKSMMVYIIKTIITLNFPIITEIIFNTIPKYSHNRLEIIKEVGKPPRNYKWLIYRILMNIKERYETLTHKQVLYLYSLFVKENKDYIIISDVVILLEKMIEFLLSRFKKIIIEYDILWI